MGAVIETIHPQKQIPSIDPFLSNFNFSTPYSIIEKSQLQTIFQFSASDNKLTKQMSKNKLEGMAKKMSSSKLNVTYKPNVRKQKVEESIFEKKTYVMKKIVSAQQNLKVIQKIMQSLELKNGQFKKENKIFSNFEKIFGYYKDFQPFSCGNINTIGIIFEHNSEYTLQDQIKTRNQSLMSKNTTNQDKKTQKQQYLFKIDQILKITRFLLQTAQSLLVYPPMTCTNFHHLPKITTSSILPISLPQKPLKLKYRNPVDSTFCHSVPTIYSSVSSLGMTLTQNLINSVGMCILGICLLDQNVYESCADRQGEICVSMLQYKIQEIFQNVQREAGEYIAKKFCCFLEDMVFQGKGSVEKMSLSGAKSICNKISIQLHKKVLKTKSQFDTTNYLVSDLSTSFTQNLNRKGSLQKNSAGSYPCIPQEQLSLQHPNLTINVKKSGRMLSSAKNYQPAWSIPKSDSKKIQINQTKPPKTGSFQVDLNTNKRKALQNISNLQRYEQIDKKWIEEEDIFRNMPSFENIASRIFDFDIEKIQKIDDIEAGEPISVFQ